MKKTVILIAACLVAAVAFSQVFTASIKKSDPAKALATFKWTATMYDFGNVKKDVPVTHEFMFTNSGSEALIISSVQASCGCTVTDYSREAILVGEKGYVKATFNAANLGIFTKTISVKANTEEPVVLLSIRGEVVQ